MSQSQRVGTLVSNRGGRAFQREILSRKKYQLLARNLWSEFYSLCNIRTWISKRIFARIQKKGGHSKRMRKLLNKQIGKGIHHLEFSQTFLAEYFDLWNELSDSAANLEDMFPSLIEGTLQLASTSPGITVMINVLTHGNAKIRKQILKQLRGRGNDVGIHQNGYLLILKIFDCVDDTVLVRKAVLNDLVAGLEALILDINGCKLILHLLAPGENRYFNARDISVLSLKGKYSKKDNDIRRKELLTPVKAALGSIVKSKAIDLLQSSHASKVVYEYITRQSESSPDDENSTVQEMLGGDQVRH